MRELLVVGIGPGHPDQITVQAVEALNRAPVHFVVDKGTAKGGLLDVRDEILRRHLRDPAAHRLVAIDDPPRDRGADAYEDAVADWHAARATRYADAVLDTLPDGGAGAFLVWGDPGLYDSTLRILDLVRASGRVEFTVTVVPGVTSVHALGAAHGIPLNRTGEPLHITPARRIADGLPDHLRSAIVMLDAGFAPAAFDEPADLDVFWGAYVGLPYEELVAGPLAEVAPHIVRRRAELRAHHGWIMDSYLLRRRPDPRP